MGSIPILPANILTIKDMNRFRLVCIGVAVLIAAMIMCSCVANPDSDQVRSLNEYSEYKIEKVASYRGSLVRVFKITTPSETFLVAESPKGTFTLLK